MKLTAFDDDEYWAEDMSVSAVGTYTPHELLYRPQGVNEDQCDNPGLDCDLTVNEHVVIVA